MRWKEPGARLRLWMRRASLVMALVLGSAGEAAAVDSTAAQAPTETTGGASGSAASSPSSSSEALGFALHGFVLADYAGRVSRRNPPGGADFMFGEELGRLEVAIEPSGIDAAGRFKIDVAHDAIANQAILALREAYVDYRAGPFDFRLGRQVLTWGVGDLEFVNDVFPKDYASFFVGRPIEYLKVPNDALRTTFTVDSIALDVVAIPFFAPDGLPTPDRFIYSFDPFVSVTNRQTSYPQASLKNTELAARLYGSLLETDLALYAYRGFFHSPSFMPDNPMAPTTVTAFFPALSVCGASLQRNLLGGVFSAEGGYYDSRDNEDATNPLIPVSFGKWLAGYQREFVTDFTVGVQYVGQLMDHYGTYRDSVPPGMPVVDQYLQTMTFRATLLLVHQTLKLSAFAVVGITERDLLGIPEVEYKLSDRLSVVLGSNILAGRYPYTTFGTFRANSNVYSWARFTF